MPPHIIDIQAHYSFSINPKGEIPLPYVSGAGGVPIYYYDPNPRAPCPIVFLHGWPLNHQMFEYQFNALQQYRCIGIDLRGFGLSGAPACGYDYDTHADDIFAVVRRLGLRDFVLAGFSMGGAIALRYICRYRGGGARKLCLLAAAVPVFTRRFDFPFGQTKETVNEMIAHGLVNRPQMVSDFGSLLFCREPGHEIRQWLYLMALSSSPFGTIGCLCSLRDEDLRPDTLTVRVPTGIFHGVMDRVCPYELAVETNRLISDSTLFTFEHSGHAIFYDELERFNDAFSEYALKM